MSPRLKKLIGTIFILVWIPIYSLIAMRIGIAVLPSNAALTFVFYLLAGTLWILPIGLLLPWMHRQPSTR